MAKIMIVDNEPFTVGIVTKILEGDGHAVIGATSGQECLEKLKGEKPDLILMDIMMPGMSGWDAVKAIRENPRLNDVLIHMLSAKQKEADKELLGMADGYITKPFERKQLLDNVREILAHKQ
jgi:CheY-like chemotaxis protein